MQKIVKALGLVLISLLILTMVACGGSNQSSSNTTTTTTTKENNEKNLSEVASSDEKEDWPKKIVHGILPTEDQAQLAKRFEPLIEYMEEQLGIEYELFYGTDYTALIEAMRNGHLDVAHFGPFAYTLAYERSGAEAFSVAVNDPDDKGYYAQFITLEGSGIESLNDLQGKKMAYADPASNSGHLFPKAMLINELGLTMDNVDDHFSYVTFSGSHEASLYSVLNEDVDVAGVCDVCIERVFERVQDHPNFGKLKVIAQSTTIPRGPTTLRQDLPESLKEAIKEAFYKMHNEKTAEKFLTDSGYWGYLEVENSDYDIIRDTAGALNMGPEDLFQ